jgi:glycerol transport system permease protein
MSRMALFPDHPVIHNYVQILTDPSWYWGYINSFAYVSINTVICLVVALPAAYAFSRYRFLGDKHLFFWLLTNRMAPAAVFLLPVFQLYSALGLLDTYIAVALAHTLFNVPLAAWILEGFMSGVPREIDETAFIDGYSLPRFFLMVFIPLIRAGVGVIELCAGASDISSEASRLASISIPPSSARKTSVALSSTTMSVT